MLLFTQVVSSQWKPLLHHWMSWEDQQSVTDPPSWSPAGQPVACVRTWTFSREFSRLLASDVMCWCHCSQWCLDQPRWERDSAGTGLSLSVWLAATGSFYFGWLKCSHLVQYFPWCVRVVQIFNTRSSISILVHNKIFLWVSAEFARTLMETGCMLEVCSFYFWVPPPAKGR